MEMSHSHEPLDLDKIADLWTVEAVTKDPMLAMATISAMALHIKYLRDRIDQSTNVYSNARPRKRGW